MTEPLKAEDIPAHLRDIARAAFSGQPPRADGTLLLDTGRNPWRALDEALAAVLPEHEKQIRAEFAAEWAAILQEMREDGHVDLRTPIHMLRDIARGES